MIDKKEFLSNLKLTKNYCNDKIQDSSKSLASILRTINPTIRKTQIFDYEFTQFGYSDIEDLTLVKWNLNNDQYYTDIVENLFRKQLSIKKENTKKFNNKVSGRILVSEYQCSVTDGASEVEAKGLIDIYDLPPIDTWFYIDKKNDLLFSWIPEKFTELINQAVLVNCLGMLRWMDTDYKNLYGYVFDENLESIQYKVGNKGGNKSKLLQFIKKLMS